MTGDEQYIRALRIWSITGGHEAAVRCSWFAIFHSVLKIPKLGRNVRRYFQQEMILIEK